MKVEEAIKQRRSIRKFKDKRISFETLKNLVESARIAPSAANRQPLEYLIIDDPTLERQVFEHTHWAGYLDWEPLESERPRAYIFILVREENQTENYKYDVGAAAENICLSAVEKGLGTCLLKSIDRTCLRSLLNIPESVKLDLAIAIGVPDQAATIEEAEKGEIEYWMDESGQIHVPKRKLEDILYLNRFKSYDDLDKET